MKRRGLLLLIVLLACRAHAADGVYVFAAPPRESAEEGQAVYGPIADYLGKVTGKKWEYRHPGNWLTYINWVTRDAADLFFDGPHFVGYRIQYHNHDAVAKLPKDFPWVIAYRKGTEVNLWGHTACLHAPPNFGTLIYLNEFRKYPARSPSFIVTKGWDNAVNGVIEGRCKFTIVRDVHVKRHDTQGTLATQILSTYPNQGMTLSPSVSAEMREHIKAALLSPEGQTAMLALRKRFAKGEALVAISDPSSYAGAARLLVTEYLEPMQLMGTRTALHSHD